MASFGWGFGRPRTGAGLFWYCSYRSRPLSPSKWCVAGSSMSNIGFMFQSISVTCSAVIALASRGTIHRRPHLPFVPARLAAVLRLDDPFLAFHGLNLLTAPKRVIAAATLRAGFRRFHSCHSPVLGILA